MAQRDAVPNFPGVTFLMFHGNAGNRYHRLEWLQLLREELGVNVCMVDYRGYGGSGGTPTEAGIKYDALAAH